jgi:hypothetical protein
MPQHVIRPAGSMSDTEPFEVIHLGGEPLEAEIEATLAAHDEWLAAGCPDARSHVVDGDVITIERVDRLADN